MIEVFLNLIDNKHIADFRAAVAIAPAGGLEDGSFGTSFEKIQTAIQSVYSDDGVLVLMDMGSAVMTTELVTENLKDDAIRLVDCPLVEGAVLAAVAASGGADIEAVVHQAESARELKKLG